MCVQLSNGGSTGTSSSRPEDGLPTASPVAQDLTRDSKNLPGKIPSIDTGSEVDQLPEGDDHVGGGAPTDLDSGGASAPVVRDHNASNIAPSQSSEHDASNGSWASAEQQVTFLGHHACLEVSAYRVREGLRCLQFV